MLGNFTSVDGPKALVSMNVTRNIQINVVLEKDVFEGIAGMFFSIDRPITDFAGIQRAMTQHHDPGDIFAVLYSFVQVVFEPGNLVSKGSAIVVSQFALGRKCVICFGAN